MQLRGRHTLITGASHGIGVRLAEEFHARGARVTVLGRDKARLDEVAERVGGQVVVADLVAASTTYGTWSSGPNAARARWTCW